MEIIIAIAVVWSIVGAFGTFVFLLADGVKTIRVDYQDKKYFKIILTLFACGPLVWAICGVLLSLRLTGVLKVTAKIL